MPAVRLLPLLVELPLAPLVRSDDICLSLPPSTSSHVMGGGVVVSPLCMPQDGRK